jgi:hypothetical protein
VKTITVSNALYGAIWLRATEDDKSEEDILGRLLQSTERSPSRITESIVESPRNQPGFFDVRSGVRFPQGFRIYRTFKGEDYTATASDGQWSLSGHLTPYDSVAALSAAIGAPTENAWFGWRYDGKDGKPQFINELRSPDVIKRRRIS